MRNLIDVETLFVSFPPIIHSISSSTTLNHHGAFLSEKILMKGDQCRSVRANEAPCLTVTRGGVSDNICGQKEAQPGVLSARGRGQQQELYNDRRSDFGSPPPAGCLLLHRQRGHPAPAAPPPDCIHRHTGTWRSATQN